MGTIERKLQQNLNKIQNLATSNGFKFSESKTQCVYFCQLRKQHDDPVLHLYGSPIPVVEESKFLGILFDRKVSFIPHIKYLKAKCSLILHWVQTELHFSRIYYIPINDTVFVLSVFWPSDTESWIIDLRFSDSVSLFFKTRLTSVT